MSLSYKQINKCKLYSSIKVNFRGKKNYYRVILEYSDSFYRFEEQRCDSQLKTYNFMQFKISVNNHF